MKITVTFDSLDEFAQYIQPGEGFEPEPRNVFEEAKQKAAEIAQDAPEGFKPVNDTPWDEKSEETAAPAVTEDYRVEVRKFLAKLNKQTGKNTAKELIQQFGATKLTDVKLEDLPALMAKAEEAFNA